MRSRSFAARCVSAGLIAGCFEGGGGLTSTPTTEVLDAYVPTDAAVDGATHDASATSTPEYRQQDASVAADAGHESGAGAAEEAGAARRESL